MCGIVGFCGAGAEQQLIEMTDAIQYRGPDSSGYHIDPSSRVFLGHRRLAILDLEGGYQPLWNEDQTICIIFNGEIYNHTELRAQLIAAGHIFRSDHSDTEVLVHGYEEWGRDLLLKLNGMFAFAIFDQPRRQLFLARDRFGEKPLYYATGDDFFAFGSELKSLTLHPSFDRRLDVRSLQKFFAYGFFPAPRTPFRQSFKLPAGSYLVYDIEKNTFHTRQYWRFSLEPDHTLGEKDEPRLIEELQHLFSQSVKRRLISDVPLGIFLSGGLDSSSVLAAAAEQLPPESLKTFTIGFNENTFDESEYARQVADYFQTQHFEKKLDISTAKDLIASVLTDLAEPIGDSSILPTFLLCRFAREQVTVALSGDGGDELFAGYDTFKALSPASMYQKFIPPFLHQTIRNLADLMPCSTKNMSFDFKVKRGLMGMSYPQRLWNPVWLSPVDPALISELFFDPVSPEELYEEAIVQWEAVGNSGSRALDVMDKTMEFYTNFYLQDNILKKVDLAAMLSSLESRAVFLDNDLVDFCRRLPNRFKFHQGESKYLLKKALSAKLPEMVLKRPKKGFGIPLAKWLKEIPILENSLQIPEIRSDWIYNCWHMHRQGKQDHRLAIWCWLSLHYFLNSMQDPCFVEDAVPSRALSPVGL